MASEKSTDETGSRYNKGTIRGDPRYLVASKGVRRHRLISISYISHGRCHGRGREFESRRPRHLFKHLQQTQKKIWGRARFTVSPLAPNQGWQRAAVNPMRTRRMR